MKVTVRLFGTLRVDSGVSGIEMNVEKIPDIYEPLYLKILETRPDTPITLKFLKSCLIAVNGERANKKTPLRDGDEVYIFTSAAGG